jgi:hypothetical protein
LGNRENVLSSMYPKRKGKNVLSIKESNLNNQIHYSKKYYIYIYYYYLIETKKKKYNNSYHICPRYHFMVLAGSIWVSFWDKIDHRIIKSTFPYLNEPNFIKTIQLKLIYLHYLTQLITLLYINITFFYLFNTYTYINC